jgi:hypothetical protein
MPIPVTDIALFYSGSSTKNTAGGNQGGAISSFQVLDQDLTSTSLTPETMWRNVTSAERNNGVVKYHCWYVRNKNATNTATGIKVYISAETTSPDSLRLGYSGNTPNTLEQALGAVTQKKIYTVPLSTSQARMDNDRTRAAQSVDSTLAKLYNIAPTSIDVWMQRIGNPSTATPVHCFIKSLNSETTRADFGTIAVSSITSDSAQYHFENLSNTYRMKVDDVIAFEYKSGTSNDCIAVNRVGTDPVAYSHQYNYDGQQWRNVSDFDLCMDVSIPSSSGGIDTQAPTGVTFTNPTTVDNAISLPDLSPGSFVGIWGQLTVPTRSAYYSKGKSEISIVYNSPA